jgi:hypothetical protein
MKMNSLIGAGNWRNVVNFSEEVNGNAMLGIQIYFL